MCEIVNLLPLIEIKRDLEALYEDNEDPPRITLEDIQTVQDMRWRLGMDK